MTLRKWTFTVLDSKSVVREQVDYSFSQESVSEIAARLSAEKNQQSAIIQLPANSHLPKGIFPLSDLDTLGKTRNVSIAALIKMNTTDRAIWNHMHMDSFIPKISRVI